MSAPDTSLERQSRRHRPALWGIAASLGFAAILTMGYLFWSAGENSQQTPTAPAAGDAPRE